MATPEIVHTDHSWDIALEMSLALSVDEQIICKNTRVYNTSRVLSELHRLNQQLDDCDLEESWPSENRPTKKKLLEALVVGRKRLIAYKQSKGEEWKAEVEAEVTSRYEGSIGDPHDIVKQELEYTFFTFDGTAAKANATNNKVTIPRQRILEFTESRRAGAIAETIVDDDARDMMEDYIISTDNA